MGQGNGVQTTVDTISSEQFREFMETEHRIVHRAFQKCVVPSSKGAEDGFDLTLEERNCVEEYAVLYAGFMKKSFIQFTSLYQQHYAEMMERSRREFQAQQAREELHQ